LFVAAVMWHNWLETESFGHPGLNSTGLADVERAVFGIRGYCLGTNLTGFIIDAIDVDPSSTAESSPFADVCFQYKEEVTLIIDGVPQTETGCQRFANGVLEGADPCSKRRTVVILMIGAISCSMIGSIYSEKPILNGIMLIFASVCAAWTIFLWTKLVTSFEDLSRSHSEDGIFSEAKFTYALGFKFLAGGCVMGFLSGTAGLLDRCVCASEGQVARAREVGAIRCLDDGIGYSGRLGSALTVISWILLLAALGTGDWVTTEQLGTAGCFCSSEHWTNKSSGCAGPASFGLWEFCVSPLIDQYNHEAYPVCWKYTDLISTPGSGTEVALKQNCTAMTATGFERFAEWNVQEKRFITGWGLIGAIALVMIADVYSEKLMLCCGLNFAATGVGVFCTIVWISFFEDLAKGTDSRMSFGTSGWLLVAAFGCTALTAILYGKDWLCNVEHEMTIVKGGKEMANIDFDGNDIEKPAETDDEASEHSDDDHSDDDGKGSNA